MIYDKGGRIATEITIRNDGYDILIENMKQMEDKAYLKVVLRSWPAFALQEHGVSREI